MSAALQAGAYRHRLHFASPGPERLVKFHGYVMDMTVEEPSRGA